MSPVFDAAIPTLGMIVKVSALMAAAALAQALVYRRASAAARHLLWTLAVGGLLVLPMLSVVLPNWQVPLHVTAWTPGDLTSVDEPSGRPGLPPAPLAGGDADTTSRTLAPAVLPKANPSVSRLQWATALPTYISRVSCCC